MTETVQTLITTELALDIRSSLAIYKLRPRVKAAVFLLTVHFAF